MVAADDINEQLEAARKNKYIAVAEQKRQTGLGGGKEAPFGDYFIGLITRSENRSDSAAEKDRKQINKDLKRTFQALPEVRGPGGSDALLPLLKDVLNAYIERGRSMSARNRTQVLHLDGANPVTHAGPAATTARGILEGYPQGLNFLAGMSLLAVGCTNWDGADRPTVEEHAFWLLSMLLEDVLDPDFFGADVKNNMKMAFVGGLGIRGVVIELAKGQCPQMHAALGPEAFRTCLGAVLDQWVLSLFVGCAPARLLEHLWDHLLLPSPYNPTEMTGGVVTVRESARDSTKERRLSILDPLRIEALYRARDKHFQDTRSEIPRGLLTVVAFALAALKCCGEEPLAGSQTLARLTTLRVQGMEVEDLSLEAAEAVQNIRKKLMMWPAQDDAVFLGRATQIIVELGDSRDGFLRVWEAVRKRKQRIVDSTDNYDEQMMSLAQRTHFTMSELGRLRAELDRLQKSSQKDKNGEPDGISLEGFQSVVQRTVPEFPPALCGRLFEKLDVFGLGKLSFAELACGMSALSLGTMDEKLQVCFDLFDSEGQRALSLKDLGDLCTVLFRVALSQGLVGTRVSNTDEVLEHLAMQNSRDNKRRSMPTVINDDSLLSNRDSLTSNSDQPWRSMLLRLLAAAEVRTTGGPWLVAFEDFRAAAHMEPALLCLFSWCLPRPPDLSAPSFFESNDTDDGLGVEKKWSKDRLGDKQAGPCGRFCAWVSELFGRRKV